MADRNGVDSGGAGDNYSIEKIYQKKSQLEHILLRPDTYIGSVEPVTEMMWVYNSEEEMMVQRELTYVPGLYKIFDEILVNAADNKQRDPQMDCIKIDINSEDNVISIYNNGKGIPVVEHKDEKMFVPTMIFGHLLTSSNYNDEEEKVTGGRNGYGAKLCNIFCTKFTVETSSKQYKRAFKQTWHNNMGKASEVKLKDSSSDDYTKITFSPDLSKFKMEKLDNDIVAIMTRRAYDVAASSRGVKVFLNSKRLPIKSFKDYIDLYIKGKEDEMGNPLKVIYECVGPRWEVALTMSDKGFQQMSFVNSIATIKGGRHVDYVADALTKQLTEVIKKKNKDKIVIKPFQIKSQMWLFINCLIVNPTFDSQTKEHMTLQSKNFGSKCQLSEKFMIALAKSGLVENVLSLAKLKAQSMLEKATGGKKKSKLKGVPKLEDANDAGTKNSLSCTLILTEGDSAKSLAVSGLAVVGRDKYGVFPLRGKLLNVREATHKQIYENAEINNIVKIMGLQYKKKYETREDMQSLRYGKLMIMTDQDQDGSHIKGLIVNFIHHNWPSLIKIPFLEVFITPIIKATKKNSEISFYSIPEFEEWKADTPNANMYRIKYYKGLGTSTSKEAREYFSNMERHRITFKYSGPECDQHIVMAFSKKSVDQRKEWLSNWMAERKRRKELGLPEEYLYTKNTRSISYKDFINKELVLFSNMDNERSIPSMVDGLKPGSRKVLFTCLKRNDKREIKVAQLAGSVAEHSAYHHGEQSLMSTIINLAQNFVGSNNINILQPIGQFGTRLQGGKDAASPRYIFTMLSPLTRLIFHPHDDPLLNYLKDDNQKIEPVWYMPIIPMLLVNGADGIGTGWMTKIPNFNPRELIANIRCLLNKSGSLINLKPWYKNFRGSIDSLIDGKYVISGEVSILGEEKVEITELPIGTWTSCYKETVLEVMSNGSDKIPPQISDYKEYTTDTTVRFVVSLPQDKLVSAENEGLHKFFKLQTTYSLSSMCVFDKDNCLRRFDSVNDIIKEYFDLRVEYYGKRKYYLEGMLQAEADKLSAQARFIVEKCNNTLIIENKKKVRLIQDLIDMKYPSDPIKEWKEKVRKEKGEEEEEGKGEDDESETSSTIASTVISVNGPDFDYLLGMSMWSLTQEKKDELLNKRNDKQAELETLQMKTPGDLWTEDLDALSKKLDEVEEKEKKDELANISATFKAKGKAEKGKRKSGMVDEVMPSAYGRLVAPSIDEEMKKKAEIAVRLKEKKAKGPTIKREPDEKDEFDVIEEENQKSLAARIGNSPSLIDKKMKEKKKELKSKTGQAKAKAPPKGSPKKKKTNPWSDSSEDENFEEGFSNSDDDVKPTQVKPTRKTSRRSAANITFKFDSEDSDGFGSSSGDEKKKAKGKKKLDPSFSSDEENKQKAPAAISTQSKGDSSDSDHELVSNEADDSDKLFDFLLVGSKPTKSGSNASLSDDNDSPPSVKPPPPQVAKKTKAKNDNKEKAEPKKKKAAPKEKRAPAPKRPKKKSDMSGSDEDLFCIPPKSKIKRKKVKDSDSNSESDMSLSDVEVPPPRTISRVKKPVLYKFDDSD